MKRMNEDYFCLQKSAKKVFYWRMTRGVMARNIEVKARVTDIKATQKRIESLAGKSSKILTQEDTFFRVPNGRLKLRIENRGGGQLIHYVREDMPGPKKSDYEIVQVADAEGLKKVLAASLEVRGIVKKERRLYIYRNTRIHLDQVDGLGAFIELEVVQTVRRIEKLNPEARAEELMRDLGIMQEDLIECAYIDLLENEAR